MKDKKLTENFFQKMVEVAKQYSLDEEGVQELLGLVEPDDENEIMMALIEVLLAFKEFKANPFTNFYTNQKVRHIPIFLVVKGPDYVFKSKMGEETVGVSILGNKPDAATICRYKKNSNSLINWRHRSGNVFFTGHVLKSMIFKKCKAFH